MNYDDCTTALTDKTIVVEERGKRFIVANLLRKTISKTQVDGCLFDETHEKCDWIISYENGKVKVALFIELKGTDLNKAYSQLLATLDLTRAFFLAHTKSFYIICARVPKAGPKTQVLKKKFLNNTRCNLHIKTLQHIETI